VARLTPATGHRVFFYLMKKRILLVNEDPAVQRMIFRVLTGEGHQVFIADHEGTSFKSGLCNDSDVVLLDSDVQDEKMLGVLERLSAEGHLPPTILLSTRADLVQSHGLKLLAVMDKPLDLPRLLQIIEALPDRTLAVGPKQQGGLASAA
jgi:DNA-binding response OmpR family regulator